MNGSEYRVSYLERIPNSWVQHARRDWTKCQRTGGKEKLIPEGTLFTLVTTPALQLAGCVDCTGVPSGLDILRTDLERR